MGSVYQKAAANRHLVSGERRPNPAIDPGDVKDAATSFSFLYNAGLSAALGAEPGIQVIDIFSGFRQLVINPQDFGLTNSVDA